VFRVYYALIYRHTRKHVQKRVLAFNGEVIISVVNCDFEFINQVIFILTFIATKCPGNKVWSDCASECPKTCRNLLQVPSAYCQASQVGRCVCGPGEVEYGDSCIQATECPCLYDGKEHAAGSIRKFDCNTW